MSRSVWIVSGEGFALRLEARAGSDRYQKQKNSEERRQDLTVLPMIISKEKTMPNVYVEARPKGRPTTALSTNTLSKIVQTMCWQRSRTKARP